MIFPDFFIAGSQKCGTSSLARWLDQHPELVCSMPKEPRFFSLQKLIDEQGDYQAYFKCADTVDGHNIKRFEASTSIMNDEVAVTRIQEMMPDTPKFIFILKDPVRRAVSAYYHMFKHHSDKRNIADVFDGIPEDIDDIFDWERKKIEQAIAVGDIDISGYAPKYDNYLWPYHYLYNSLYSRHITRFEELYGRKNILVLTLTMLKKDPKTEFKKITDFLSVAPFDKLPDTAKKSNPTRIPSYLLNSSVRESRFLLGIMRFFDKCCVHPVAKIIKKPLLRSVTPPVPENIQRDLEKILKTEIEFLTSIQTMK